MRPGARDRRTCAWTSTARAATIWVRAWTARRSMFTETRRTRSGRSSSPDASSFSASVGQTFLYGAKGGEAFVMGVGGRTAADQRGRANPRRHQRHLPRLLRRELHGRRAARRRVRHHQRAGLRRAGRGHRPGEKYPGNNLFSLASGGACYLNDPYETVSEIQLNGATFVPFKQADWNSSCPTCAQRGPLRHLHPARPPGRWTASSSGQRRSSARSSRAPRPTRLDWSSLPD